MVRMFYLLLEVCHTEGGLHWFCLSLDSVSSCLGLGLNLVSIPQCLGLVSDSIHSSFGYDLVSL